MGSPDFAAPTLYKLISSKHDIIACFSKEAKPKNRGKKLQDTIIAQIAKKHNIDLFTPKNFNDDDIVNYIKEQNIDFLVVVAYGLILPQKILDLAKYAALNLHPSALPEFRGAAPIQRTIMAGKAQSKICIIKMNQDLDAGDIMLQEDISLDKHITAGEFHDQAALIGANLMLQTIDNYQDLQPQKQDLVNISYAHKITKEDTKIDFSDSGHKIINLIRGLAPRPGASFTYKDLVIKIFAAEFISKEHQETLGSINKNWHIYCKDGLIIPHIIQKSGKGKMSLAEFIRGI